MSRHTFQARRAFTLVEVLIVVAIIGILMGLALVGINAARKSIQGSAISMEIQSLSTAVEAYKTKFQAYPPDGSSMTAFESHFRSRFPNIASTEFTILYSVANSNVPTTGPDPVTAVDPSDTGVMDPAEALVFCLGGFSKSETNPFTGPGGPIDYIEGSMPAVYQYNVDRNDPLFDFSQDRLTLDTSMGTTVSNDEVTLGVINAQGKKLGPDLLPVYIPKYRTVPFVYFASGTYRVDSSAGSSFNFYASPSFGVARPYKSDNVNTKSPLTGSSTLPQRDRYYSYANDKSFQIISAGLDDNFGGSMVGAFAVPMFFRYPSGEPLDITQLPNAQPAGGNYQAMSGPTAGDISQLDNVTNFSEGALSNSLK